MKISYLMMWLVFTVSCHTIEIRNDQSRKTTGAIFEQKQFHMAYGTINISSDDKPICPSNSSWRKITVEAGGANFGLNLVGIMGFAGLASVLVNTSPFLTVGTALSGTISLWFGTNPFINATNIETICGQ